jgi:raffinose/stachyose/melibiose transport system permease protein
MSLPGLVPPQTPPVRDTRGSGKRSEHVQAYAMLSPSLLGFVLFSLYPIVWMLRWCFFDYDGFSAPRFTGFANFVRGFAHEPDFWRSILNILGIAVSKLAIEIPLAVVLAVLLNQKSLRNTVLRVTFFLPSVISVAITGLIFSGMFASYNGVVNQVLEALGLIRGPIRWFQSEWTSLAVIALSSLWMGFGINMVYVLMGLQSIPAQLYECARLDGAGKVYEFFHITLPMLSPILKVIVMLALLGTMRMADLVLILTNGEPARRTEVVMSYIFKYYFSYGSVDGGMKQYGYAAALSVITALILGFVTVFYLRSTRRMNEA